ncbi:hypothetical protein [Zhihengliuella sp.]|uniref:hypothetical protein n=1 Tax=Zhihengliuella sp. TaxID=1954483 RepID=UPI00281234A3|nr:hypothetical protein [Zhihengliuella sp.]
MSRCSLLFVIAESPLSDAIRQSIDLAVRYREDLLLGLPVDAEELYAFGEAERIQEKIRPPRPTRSGDPAETSLGPVHAIWRDGGWLTPESCPPAPPEDNGATAWQWAHYNAVMEAPPRSYLVLWDLQLADELAA